MGDSRDGPLGLTPAEIVTLQAWTSATFMPPLPGIRDGLISEALVIDWQHEGMRNGFELDLLRRFPLPGVPLIAFGGLSETAQIEEVLGMPHVVAVGVGNFLNYTEHSVQHYKERLVSSVLRRPEDQVTVA